MVPFGYASQLCGGTTVVWEGGAIAAQCTRLLRGVMNGSVRVCKPTLRGHDSSFGRGAIDAQCTRLLRGVMNGSVRVCEPNAAGQRPAVDRIYI